MHPNRKDVITHEQAKKSLQRFVNLHFKNVGEKSRASIPAHQDDDDILLSDYISQQESGPELGSGALREALKYGDVVWVPATVIRVFERQLNVGIHRLGPNQHSYYAMVDKSEVALSLSSPIEPRERELESLIVHMWIHSGYTKNGYQQMTTPQKALYDSLVGRSEEIAERDMPQTAVMRERAQASSEIREARVAAFNEAIDAINGVRFAFERSGWADALERVIKLRNAALSPSRQGAGGK